MVTPAYGLLTSLDEVRTTAEVIATGGVPFGVDIETGYDGEAREKASLHPEENFVVGISLTNSLNWARYIPLRHDTGLNLDNSAVAELLWPLFGLRDAEGLPLAVAHGAKFELRCLSRWFVRYLSGHPVYGPQVMACLPRPGYFEIRSCTLLESFVAGETPNHGLKDTTERIFRHKQTELHELFESRAGKKLTAKQKNSIRFNSLPSQDLDVVCYACEDSLWALAHHLRRFATVRNNPVYQLEMAVLPVVCDMEDEGLVYDWNMLRDAARKALEFGELYKAEVLEDLSALAGESVLINLNSAQQLRDVLYVKCKLPVTHWTDGGKKGKPQPSTDAKTALKGLSRVHPEVAKLLDWKGLDTLRNNFLEPFEARHTYAADNRAHPSFLQHGTIAGRFSAQDPNPQQSPKKKYRCKLRTGESFEFNFRDVIKAPEGWYILGYDYSQIELRIFAAEAQEQSLLEAFAHGADVHRLTASRMLSIPLDAVDEEARYVGKTMNFALAYSMTEVGLSDRLGITYAEAEQKFAEYHAAYPNLKHWTDRTIAQGRADGFVTTSARLVGRRVRVWEFDEASWKVRKDAERTAGNAPIQGSAADYMKIAMVRAHYALRRAGLADCVRMCLNVHDALEFYVRGDVAPEDVIAVLRPAVEFPVEGWPYIPAVWHLGERWGSVVELEVLADGTVQLKKDEEPPGGGGGAGQRSVAGGEGTVVVPEAPAAVAAVGEGGHGSSSDSPDPGGHGHPRVAGYQSRRVIIIVHDMPGLEELHRLKDLLISTPGFNSVSLQTPQGPVEVPFATGLTPADEPRVSVILGGAFVHYELDSVDTDSLADGLEL